jgi:hypothetical protein
MNELKEEVYFFFYFDSLENANDGKKKIKNILNRTFYVAYIVDIYETPLEHDDKKFTIKIINGKLEMNQIKILDNLFQKNFNNYDGWSTNF